MKKKHLLIKLILITAAALVLAFFFLANPLFHLNFGFIRTRQTVVSNFVLENARPIFSLQAAEYTLKTVFPFDYITFPDVYESALKNFRRGNELEGSEKELEELIKLMQNIDFSLRKKTDQFVVMSLKIRAGYDFTEMQELPEEDFRNAVMKMLSFDYRKRIVYLTLPEPVITDIIIEDPDPQTYQYPDIALSPKEWMQVASFVIEKLPENEIIIPVLNEARENTKLLLKELFLSGGWNDVVFLLPVVMEEPADADAILQP